MSEGIRPFSNGSQYLDWLASNCEKGPCSKARHDDLSDSPCQIEQAFDRGYITGEITSKIAKRMGYLENGLCYVWPCPEHDPPFDLREFKDRIKKRARVIAKRGSDEEVK